MSDLRFFGEQNGSENQPALAITTLPVEGNDEWMKTLVAERLAACVTKLPSAVSTYRWQEKIVTDDENVWMIKTTLAKTEALVAEIRKNHPYEVPEIIVFAINAINESYWQWLLDSTSDSFPHT